MTPPSPAAPKSNSVILPFVHATLDHVHCLVVSSIHKRLSGVVSSVVLLYSTNGLLKLMVAKAYLQQVREKEPKKR